MLPVDLLDGYDLDDLVTLAQYSDYDILDIHFGELYAPDEWVDYELGSLIALREEPMDGDLRALYIVWLASQCLRETSDDEEGEAGAPAVPPGLGALTSAQHALSELLQVPREVVAAAARHAVPPRHQRTAMWRHGSRCCRPIVAPSIWCG